jgi:hypothetical protein
MDLCRTSEAHQQITKRRTWYRSGTSSLGPRPCSMRYCRDQRHQTCEDVLDQRRQLGHAVCAAERVSKENSARVNIYF